VHPGALDLARQGFVTGASARNWSAYRDEVAREGITDAELALLTDPQTSGGLLVACAQDAVDDVLRTFRSQGFERAGVVGRIEDATTPRVRLCAV
jgi:selenide,water dikinase